jgi:hypothetical protein
VNPVVGDQFFLDGFWSGFLKNRKSKNKWIFFYVNSLWIEIFIFYSEKNWWLWYWW